MLGLAGRLGAETLATGHYARVDADGKLLRTAADPGKDQSYVLCALAPDSLGRLRFPLGELHKSQVREIARQAGLAVASRRDSQDLCFLAGTGSSAFLARHGGLHERAGAVVGSDGGVLGEHGGAHLYTVGQRRGLRVAAPEPMYVLATDTAANTVTVGPREALLTSSLRVDGVTLRRSARAIDGVRVRAHGRKHACRVAGDLGAGSHESVAIELARPAERTAPGQVACLYSDELIVGYGTVAA
jgi:tRNA-specific 2-thiouridylase